MSARLSRSRIPGPSRRPAVSWTLRPCSVTLTTRAMPDHALPSRRPRALPVRRNRPGPGVFVDGASYRPDHLGDFLAFVEEHGLCNRPECGIGAKARRCRLGSHIDSHKVSSQPRRRGGLPCSTRANDQQRRQMGEQVCQRAINKTRKVGCDQHSPGPLALSPTVD